jgi:hypothetical protein
VPRRKKNSSGRGVAMGWPKGAANQIVEAASSPSTLLNGESTLQNAAAFNATGGTRITTCYEPTRQNVFFAHVQKMAEHHAIDRDGWHLVGEDEEAVSKVVVGIYTQG